jgi:hypothetical protein
MDEFQRIVLAEEFQADERGGCGAEFGPRRSSQSSCTIQLGSVAENRRGLKER